MLAIATQYSWRMGGVVKKRPASNTRDFRLGSAEHIFSPRSSGQLDTRMSSSSLPRSPSKGAKM